MEPLLSIHHALSQAIGALMADDLPLVHPSRLEEAVEPEAKKQKSGPSKHKNRQYTGVWPSYMGEGLVWLMKRGVGFRHKVCVFGVGCHKG